jgi:hypothetical protein
LLQFQNFNDAWVTLDQMVQSNDSRPITGLMLLPTKELPVTILVSDQPDGLASFKYMTTHECSLFALQDPLQILAMN